AIKQGDYFNVLDGLKTSNHPKVVLFLGSNIGNMEDDKAKRLISKLSSSLNTNDKVVLGVDLIKSKDIVLPAYNDKAGVTKTFNLNVLRGVNQLRDANLHIRHRCHPPDRRDTAGIARSYIGRDADQGDPIRALNTSCRFTSGARVYAELSRKCTAPISEA